MATIGFFTKRQRHYTDMEVVTGLYERDRAIEEWFYHAAKRYFDDHFHQVFFDKDRKQEIFQTAFLKLWTEMANGRISVQDEAIYRQQTDGTYRRMTCTLNTFLMAFARTEYRELVRNTKEDTYGELFEAASHANVQPTEEEDVNELQSRIIDECIQGMSPTCVEILTLFYYQGKSLDEIMVIRGERNASKNGLKTAKNKCMNTLRERAQAQFTSMNA